MFKIAETRIAKNVPVIVKQPGDGGRFTNLTIRLDFEIITRQKFESFNDDDQLLRSIVKSWADGDVGDESGNPLSFSEENLSKLIDLTYVRTAIVETYVRTAFGDQGRRKNS